MEQTQDDIEEEEMDDDIEEEELDVRTCCLCAAYLLIVELLVVCWFVGAVTACVHPPRLTPTFPTLSQTLKQTQDDIEEEEMDDDIEEEEMDVSVCCLYVLGVWVWSCAWMCVRACAP